MEPILKLDHIQKYYGNEGNITKAIQDISFSVEAGEFLGIMGASGSGKTTLLNCISTIDTVSAGHIYLEGTDITEIKPKSLARFRRENLGFAKTIRCMVWTSHTRSNHRFHDCDCLLYSNCFSRDFSIYRIESFNVADRDDCRNISAITNLLFHQYMDTL